MTARREWHANGVSWRVIPHSGALQATWDTGAGYVSRVFYGYTRREAARLVADLRRRHRFGVAYGDLGSGRFRGLVVRSVES